MNVLALTVLVSVGLGLLFMAAFVWDRRVREDVSSESESLRPLEDDDPALKTPFKTRP